MKTYLKSEGVHRHQNASKPRTTASRTSTQSSALRAIIESMEPRTLLSAGLLDTAFATAGGAVNGLSAVYYANDDFTGTSVTRTDANVDFNWGGASPAPGIGASHFSARWTGVVIPNSGGSYTFSVQSSDGVRLWINNQIIINDWNTHAQIVTDTAAASLIADQDASLRLEFFAGTNPASIHLSWSSPSMPLAIIPTGNLAPTTDPLLGQIDSSLGFAREQLNTTLTAMNGNTTRFPFYTNPNGTWATSDVGNWTAGFFSSEMWQMFNRTNNATWQQQATTWTLPLAPDKNFTDDTTFRIFNSYLPLYQATGNPAYKQVILDAVASKMTTWNATVKAFSSVGVASHSGNPNANFGVLIDHMMDFSMVFWAAAQTGNQTWYNEALQHARTVAANFFRADGSVYQWGYFDRNTGAFVSGENYQGYNDSSAWARAQAWAIYAFTVFYRETGAADMLTNARRVADYYIAHLPADQIPYWDFNSPAIPNTYRDTSAAAIAASGLLQLGKLDPNPTRAANYSNEGKTIVTSLLSPAYLASGSSSQGILLHGAWFVPPPIQNGDASLVWGDYYVLEAMNEYLAMPGALPGTPAIPVASRPAVTLSGESTANAGGIYALSLSAASDGNGTPTQYVVNWGDGAANTYTTLGAVTHRYATTGAVNITVDLTDPVGTFSAAGVLAVTVNPAPKIAISGASTVQVNTLYSLTLGAVTDPGYTVSQYIVHWGDGATSTYTASGVVTHTYATPANATITVDLTDATGTYNSAGSLNVAVVSLAGGLFPNSLDIGSPKLPGFSSFSNGIYTVTGEGVDVWNASDQFQFDYTTVTGDVTISAQITSVQNVNSWAKAGVMIRDGIAANAAFADIVLTPAGYLAFQWRAKAGGTCSQSVTTMKTAPQYVKLVHAGDSFTAYYSSTGTTWTQLGSAQTITMAPAATTGLAVTSINTSKTCTATFANVALITPTAVGLFTDNIDIGSPKVAGGSSFANGIYTITGEGTDIWNTSDQFQYDYQSVTGDVTISAQITSVQNVNSWAKAGVMIRDGTAANAAFADVVLTPAGYLAFQWRAKAGSTCSQALTTMKTVPQYVKLVRAGNSFTAYYSSNGATWTQLGTAQTIAMAPAVTTGLAVTSINTTKTCTATFANVNVTTTIATGLFTTNTDIGSPSLAGSASFSNGVYTITGEGTDIWNTSDQFQYDYKNAAGDITISAQVTSLQNVHPWSKAGVMIRDGIAANAAFADVVLTPGGYLAFQWRASAGGICSQSLVAMKIAPQYVKLVRAGNSFTAYYSSDGTAWTQVGIAQTIAMAPAVTTGLAVTSINTSKTCTATFSSVSVS